MYTGVVFPAASNLPPIIMLFSVAPSKLNFPEEVGCCCGVTTGVTTAAKVGVTTTGLATGAAGTVYSTELFNVK